MKTVNSISEKAIIGINSTIGEFVVIENGAIIGNGVTVGNNAVIKQDTVIGDGVTVKDGAKIGVAPHKTKVSATTKDSPISPLQIGDGSAVGYNAVVYRGSVIGKNVYVADLASVRENVEIGDNTVIGKGATIENNVSVGKNCKINNSYNFSVIHQLKLTTAYNINIALVKLSKSAFLRFLPAVNLTNLISFERKIQLFIILGYVSSQRYG